MQKQTRSNNTMIQILEPRRLMSLTAGFDIPHAAPPAEGPIRVDHYFGVQQQQNIQQFGGQADINFPLLRPFVPLMNAEPIGADALDAQFARAIAAGTSLVVSPTATTPTQGAVPNDQTRLTTLSSLYSTIGTSTVSAIDNATLASTAYGETLDDLVVTQSAAEPSGPAITSIATPENAAAGILLASIATHPAATHSTQAFDLDLLADHSAPSAPPLILNDTPPAESSSLLSRNLLNSLEQELLAVKARSQEVVWNMSRDTAIAQSHAQSNALIAQDKSSDWKTTATVIGAAIASIVYAEKELVRGKKNVGGIFSNRELQQSRIPLPG